MKRIVLISILMLFLLSTFQTVNLRSADSSTLDPLEININDNVLTGEWVGVDDQFTYSIDYYNQNNKTINHVIIKNSLPDELSFVDASPGYNYQDGWVKWFLSNISKESGGNKWLTVSVNPEVEDMVEVTSTVIISCNETEVNSSSETTLIGNPRPLKILKDDNVEDFELPKQDNASINYTINVKNNNSVNVSDVWITDHLPAELFFVNASEDYFVDFDNGWISWYKESMSPGESVDFWIKTIVNSSIKNETWIINTVSVDSTETDENITASDPILYNTSKNVYFSKFLFEGWNQVIIKEGVIKNNDFSVEYIFSSILNETEIIFENCTTGNCSNYIPGEGGNTLTEIQENVIYWVKMNKSTVLNIIEKPNQKPVANAGGPYTTNIGKKVYLDASESYDSDGTISFYRWDFKNNGKWTNWSSNYTASYTYNEKTTYELELQVKDNQGAKSQDVTTVIVKNIKPKAKITGESKGVPDERLNFDGSQSSDPDGEIKSYKWDFDGDGTWDTGWQATPSVSHSYTNERDYKIKLIVKDNDNETDTATFDVDIKLLNNPPSKPTISGPKNGTIGKEYSFEVFSTDSDGGFVRYYLEWGDGNESSSDMILSGKKTSFSHTYKETGPYFISVYAKDEKNAESSRAIYAFEALEAKSDEAGSLPFLYVAIIIIVLVVVVGIGIIFYLDKKQTSFSIGYINSKSSKKSKPKKEKLSSWNEATEKTRDTWD